MKISKELLEAVVVTPKNKEEQPPFELHKEYELNGVEKTKYESYDSSEINFKFGYTGFYPKGFTSKISIYELAHLAKKWAWEYHSCRLVSSNVSVDDNLKAFCSVFNPNYIFGTMEETEVQSIVNACEWILKREVSK